MTIKRTAAAMILAIAMTQTHVAANTPEPPPVLGGELRIIAPDGQDAGICPLRPSAIDSAMRVLEAPYNQMSFRRLGAPKAVLPLPSAP